MTKPKLSEYARRELELFEPPGITQMFANGVIVTRRPTTIRLVFFDIRELGNGEDRMQVCARFALPHNGWRWSMEGAEKLILPEEPPDPGTTH